jgi:hypothetical protein
MIELANPDAICTTKQLTEIIGASSRSIERLTESGVLKVIAQEISRVCEMSTSDCFR